MLDHQQELQAKTREKIHIETYERSVSAAATFFILGLIITIYRFGSEEFGMYFFGLGLALCLVNLMRWLIAFSAVNKKIELEQYLIHFKTTVLLNSILWGIVFTLVFYVFSFNAIQSKIAFLIMVGICAGAPNSLVTMPRLQFIFFIFVTFAPGFVLLMKFITEGGDHEYFIIPVLVFIMFLFFISMSKKLRTLLYTSISDHEELKITQAALLEEKAKSLNSERLAFLGNMAAGVAHEINNPLTISFGQISSIEYQLNSLSDPSLKEVILTKLNRISDVNNRIKNIVKGLRDFASEGGGESFENLKLAELLEFASQFFETRIKSNNISFEREDVPDVYINCRKNQLTQAVVHVINNAIEAVENQTDKMIQIKFAKSFNKLQILISDNGKGVDPLIKDKIFQPFFTTKDVGNGIGLGLSISLGILKSHKGNMLLVESKNPTTFALEIPYY